MGFFNLQILTIIFFTQEGACATPPPQLPSSVKCKDLSDFSQFARVETLGINKSALGE